MSTTGQNNIETLEVFKHFEAVASWAWRTCHAWPSFERQTVGSQLVRAIDSVGANMVEGEGRSSNADSLRFLYIALGSAKEAKLWIQRAVDRELVDRVEEEQMLAKVTEGIKALQGLVRFRTTKGMVKEERVAYADYDLEDPLTSNT